MFKLWAVKARSPALELSDTASLVDSLDHEYLLVLADSDDSCFWECNSMHEIQDV